MSNIIIFLIDKMIGSYILTPSGNKSKKKNSGNFNVFDTRL